VSGGSGAWERDAIDILIATPISGWELVHWEWHVNTLDIWQHLPQGYNIIRQKFPEPMIDISRDKAVRMAIQLGARWIFFLDADVIPPPDVLPRLMAHKQPIVSGLYVRRHMPPFNEMLKFRTDGVAGLRPVQDGEYSDGSVVDVDAVATGCVLIRTDVFEKVPPYQLTIDGQPARPAWFFWTADRYLNNPGMSEDFSFFTRAKRAGIPILCDTSIKCKHAGPVKFLPGAQQPGGINLEFMGGG